jgi:hypothetical protein
MVDGISSLRPESVKYFVSAEPEAGLSGEAIGQKKALVAKSHQGYASVKGGDLLSRVMQYHWRCRA